MRATPTPLGLDARLAVLTSRRQRFRRGQIPHRAASNNDDAKSDCVVTNPSGDRRDARDPLIRLARRTLLSVSPVLLAATAFDDTQTSEFSPAKPNEWGYADFETGPLRWGEVLDATGARAFPSCGCAACAQSPIDIRSVPSNTSDIHKGTLRDVVVPPNKPIVLAVTQKHGTPNYVLDVGDDAEKNSSIASSGGLNLDGVYYTFNSLHFHTPAENTIDGVTNDLEAHLVHVENDGSGGIAVLGVLFKHASSDEKGDATIENLLWKVRPFSYPNLASLFYRSW